MKSRHWIVTLSSVALLSGCGVQVTEYCVLTEPILFGSQETVEWLADNDEQMLTDIIVHNERMAALCK